MKFDTFRIVFGLAMERARSEGILVDMIVLADDCCDHVGLKAGRRTLAGYVLALKVAGAMSEEEKTMKEIYLMVRSLLIVSISAHVNDANVFMGTGEQLIAELTVAPFDNWYLFLVQLHSRNRTDL